MTPYEEYDQRLEQYSDASIRNPLLWLRIVHAADQLWQAQAADPDDVASWWPAIAALDTALEQCPGTAAYRYHQIREPLTPRLPEVPS